MTEKQKKTSCFAVTAVRGIARGRPIGDACIMKHAAWLTVLVVLGGLQGTLDAQGGGRQTFEERFVEILRSRGVIDDRDEVELLSLAREAARQAEADLDFERQMDRQIEKLVAAAEDNSGRLSHRIGRGFRLESADEKFRLDLSGRIQFRFTHRLISNDPETDDQDEPSFTVERARLEFEGHVFKKWIDYDLSFDLAGSQIRSLFEVVALSMDLQSENRAAVLKNAFIRFDFDDAFALRFGQFKVPYSRQYLTSSARQGFVDRSILRSEVVPGRDVGIMAEGELGDDDEFFFEYALGVFNGDEDLARNNDKGLMYAGRVAFHVLGEVPYDEAALRAIEDIRFALGLNGWYHQDDNHLSERDDWSIGADLAVIWGRFSLFGELHYHERGRRTRDRRAVAWHLQAGFMILEETLELTARIAEVAWDQSGTEAGAREYLIGVNWYAYAHDLKIQVDFGRIELHEHDHADNVDEWRLRLQIQLRF